MTALHDSRQKSIKDGIRVGVVIAFFAGAAVLLQSQFMRDQFFDINTLRENLRSFGYHSFWVFILAAAVINALGVPRIWISAAAGTLYGAVEGTGTAMTATLLGASINFWMARKLLRGPVLRHMPQRLRPWMERLKQNAFITILYLRLFPFTNATLTNLLGGASTIPFSSFFAASILGFIPFTVIFATFGSSAAKHNGLQLIMAAFMLTLVSLAQWFYGQKHKIDFAEPPSTHPLKD